MGYVMGRGYGVWDGEKDWESCRVWDGEWEGFKVSRIWGLGWGKGSQTPRRVGEVLSLG